MNKFLESVEKVRRQYKDLINLRNYFKDYEQEEAASQNKMNSNIFFDSNKSYSSY